MSSSIQLANVTIGMSVVYVPPEARGDLAHPKVQRGIVTNETIHYVYVRFEGETFSTACLREDLR